jgi:uncharacterized protein (DUF362 family)
MNEIEELENTKQMVGLVDTSQYDDLTEAVKQALKLIHFDFRKRMKKIAIKPNLCYYWKPSTGETTDPKLVGAVIDLFRMYCNSDEIFLVESDATAMKTEYAYRMLDYEKLAEEKNVELINLSNDIRLPANVDDSILDRIKIPKMLTEVDFFVSMPKLKLHRLTGLTCALKNQFGCIPIERKIVFHRHINKVIAFINKVVTPDLVLVDGIISLGKTPKKLNLIMAGYDPVAVDFIAAKIAGLNPRRIRHLVESERFGVGSTNVKLVGDDLSLFANMFPRRGFLYNVSRKTLLQLYSLYLRLFTVEGRVLKMQPTL